MSIEECKNAYIEMMDKIFFKTKHRIGYNGKVQGRFDTSALENAIKKVIKDKGLDENSLLFHPGGKCLV